MNTPQTRPDADQREALKESEKKASETHPENFKDDETDDKVVEILPIEKDSSPIKGLDPQE